jgi:type IX secretion system PorP/SprF family membrane protein
VEIKNNTDNYLISEKMKKSVYISMLLMITGTLHAQQFPFMEGYNINPFSLSPAFAGIHNSNTLFLDYRADWTGIEGGPTTYQLSYNSKLFKKVGVGGRFIYDKTDIFKQTLLLGTYTYEIRLAEKHFINLGLSAGLYKNSIDLAKYFNNPDYISDRALVSGLEKSKLKFVSDISVLYRTGNFESGFLFSNLMFGSAKYNDAAVSYKPFKNYMFNAAYDFQVSERWNIKPFVLWRAGEHTPGLAEVAASVTFNKKVWGTALYRTAGIWGFGAGAELFDGILINYSYNLSTEVALNTFSSHQVTLGFRLFKPAKKVTPEPVMQKQIEIPVTPAVPAVPVVPQPPVQPAVPEKQITKDVKPLAVETPVVKKEIPDAAAVEIQREKIKKEVIELDVVHFETNKSVITAYSMPIVVEYIKILKENPDLRLEISGHSDNVGSPENNRKLSMERALVVVNYMISQGITADRLKAVGYGQERPLFSNDTPDNRAKNRRVEARVIE